jgi:hypothetical protein
MVTRRKLFTPGFNVLEVKNSVYIEVDAGSSPRLNCNQEIVGTSEKIKFGRFLYIAEKAD